MLDDNNKVCKLFTYANQKGGCGKTTGLQFTANILSAAPFNLNILVLDLDMQMSTYRKRQRNLTQYQSSPVYDVLTMDVESYVELLNLFDEKLNFKTGVDNNGRLVVDTGIIRTVNLPAQIKKITDSQMLYNFDNSKSFIENYDLILIDLPGSLGTEDEIQQAIFSSDVILIPYKPSELDIDSLQIFIDVLNTLREIRKEDGYNQLAFSYINEFGNTTNYTDIKNMHFDDSDISYSKVNLRNRKVYRNIDTMGESLYQLAINNEKDNLIHQSSEIKKFGNELFDLFEKSKAIKSILNVVKQ